MSEQDQSDLDDINRSKTGENSLGDVNEEKGPENTSLQRDNTLWEKSSHQSEGISMNRDNMNQMDSPEMDEFISQEQEMDTTISNLPEVHVLDQGPSASLTTGETSTCVSQSEEDSTPARKLDKFCESDYEGDEVEEEVVHFAPTKTKSGHTSLSSTYLEQECDSATPKFAHIADDHSETLCRHLHMQWLEGQHCDLTLKVKDADLRVHSCVLAAFSPLVSPNVKAHQMFMMPYVTSACLEPLLKLMYTGILCFDAVETGSVLHAAKELMLTEIVTLIQDYIKQNPNVAALVSQSSSFTRATGKITTPETIGNSVSTPGETKRKRGRPRKSIKVPQISQSSVMVVPVVKKGRPKKQKNIDDVPLCSIGKSTDNIKNVPNLRDVDQSFGSNVDSLDKLPIDIEIKQEPFYDDDDQDVGAFDGGGDDNDEKQEHDEDDEETKHAEEEKTDSAGKVHDKHDEFDKEMSKETEITKEILKPYTCQVCGYKAQTKYNLKRHGRKHTGELFKCKTCGRGFTEKYSVKKHDCILGVKGEKKFICDMCGTMFYSKIGMEAHRIDKHGAIGKKKCHHCDRTFSSKASLDYHINQHFNLKPNMCEYCGRSFTATSSLNRHIIICKKRIDTEKVEPKLDCSYCGRVFATKCRLRDHIKGKHEIEFRYSCKVCGQTFRWRPSKVRHEHNCLMQIING